MRTTILRFELRSAATFGRADGLAGLVDREVEHDEWGLPYLRGKTLKGLLAEECENLVFALNLGGHAGWQGLKEDLFGVAGSGHAGRGIMHVGDAHLPSALRAEIRRQVESDNLLPSQVLDSLTTIRRQTAMNEYGAPQRKALRSMRVVLAGTLFESNLTFEREPTPRAWALLAAAVLALRHAGTARNRGRGWLRAELGSAAETLTLYKQFEQEVAMDKAAHVAGAGVKEAAQ
jgi:hypothetical protein